MRAKYEKPMIAVERYELSQTISACAIKIASTGNDCVRYDPDTPWEMRELAFNNQMIFNTGCQMLINTGSTSTGICYHTNANAAFTS